MTSPIIYTALVFTREGKPYEVTVLGEAERVPPYEGLCGLSINAFLALVAAQHPTRVAFEFEFVEVG